MGKQAVPQLRDQIGDEAQPVAGGHDLGVEDRTSRLVDEELLRPVLPVQAGIDLPAGCGDGREHDPVLDFGVRPELAGEPREAIAERSDVGGLERRCGLGQGGGLVGDGLVEVVPRLQRSRDAGGGFGEYDDWSLRDRRNEAIRIMNTLGASAITCETFREVAVRRGVRARVLGQKGELTKERVENSGFDFRHIGAGSEPRDPRPLPR